jgi:two-component system cell cycle response regulator DivK
MANTILCIEDNSDNMLLMRRILESSGYSLLQSNNGLEGINIAETKDVDLVLLDINLPDIDGYEVTRRIRDSHKKALAIIPIIVISANALKGDAQKALTAGCDMYMTKPIDILELRDVVEKFLPSPNGPNQVL